MRIEIPEAEKDEARTYIWVPVPKASTKEDQSEIEICVEDFNDEVYSAIFAAGLKVWVNRRMEKIKDGKNDPKARQAAMKIAKDNVEKMKLGEIRVTAAKSKVSGAVQTEAMRLARAYIKELLKAARKKVSHIPASEITAAAKLLLTKEEGKGILEAAEAAVKAREAKGAEARAGGIDLSSLLGGIKEDPKLVAKAEKEKAERRKATAEKKGRGAVQQKAKAQVEHRAH